MTGLKRFLAVINFGITVFLTAKNFYTSNLSHLVEIEFLLSLIYRLSLYQLNLKRSLHHPFQMNHHREHLPSIEMGHLSDEGHDLPEDLQHKLQM